MAETSTRRIITQDSFSVAPQLLGLPLASPARRAAAMLIDIIIVSSLIKIGGAFFGLAAAFLLWKASGRTMTGGFLKPAIRTALRIAAAVALFVVVVNVWAGNDDNDENGGGEVTESQQSDADFNLNTGNLNLGGRGTINLVRWGIQLRNTDDSLVAARMADSIAGLLRRGGASDQELADLREDVHDAAQSDQKDDGYRHAIDRAFGVTPSAVPRDQQLAAEYSAALESGDQKRMDEARTQLRDALAGRDLERARVREKRQEARADSLEKQIENVNEGRGLRAMIGSIADDLGLGFGWMALYFTGCLALLRGQTPGKKIAGVRVVRLDAKPITWFISFERFGGYAASLTLGLLGFLQILWDRNRQGLHDKAVETVVIRELPKTA